jgi:enterochelin esterase-like enzyme
MCSLWRWMLVAGLSLTAWSAALAEPPNAEALIERHHREKSPVWADGDTVTFFFRGEEDKVEVIFGGDPRVLSRVAGSDVWTLAVKLPDLDRAVFSYCFIPTTKDRPAEKGPAQLAVWRGPQAPPAATESPEFRGTLQTVDIETKGFGNRRKATVYLPPGRDSKKASPVVYAADGEAIGRFAHVLEPLISTEQLPPVVLVGVHSGGYVGGTPDQDKYDVQKDLRAQEYFPGINPKRFAEHESFFCRDVPAWVEQRFGVSSEKQDRVVFGYSNGGRFAVEMGLRHPEVFGHVFGFSVAGSGQFDYGTAQKAMPCFSLAAGTWETSFHHCTSSLADQLKERGVPVRFSSRPGGHDTALWRDEFAAALLWTFGKKEGMP